MGIANAEEPKLDYAQFYNVNVPKEEPVKEEVKLEEKKIKQCVIKNEYSEALKISIESANHANQEVFVGAYENLEIPLLNSKTQYKIKVFNLQNQYLGYLRNYKIDSLVISQFTLVQEYKKENKIDINELKAKPKAQTINESNKSNIETLSRKIRVSNKSNTPIHLDIVDAQHQVIGEGWTVPNNFDSLEFLNYKSQAIEITAGSIIEIKVIGLDSPPVIKAASELALDLEGNFVLELDKF